MNAQQLAQLRAQLKVFAQLSTCASTNTRELDRASGIPLSPVVRTIQLPFPLHALATWRSCPDAPHHRHMPCSLGDVTSHQLPVALLCQERDNYIVLKMQTHLRHLRALAKASKLTKDEEERCELATHMLWMNSRQRYVRDQFYRSYVAFSSGSPLKNRDITAIVRLKPLSKAERNKCFVIRGHSYNKFLWPTGPDFIPDGPFAALPRYVIRNRQKLNPDIDLKPTLPVVTSIVSVSASVMVASHAYDFYAAVRSKYSQARRIRRDIARFEIQRNTEAQVELLRRKLFALADKDLRSEFWSPPVFTHGIHLIPTNLDLHTHQVEGVSWLVHLFDHHVNAILADEVGLGKSLQVIAFLAFLKEQRRIPGPHLITMPGSVLATWKDEFAKWLPGCSTICYYGKRLSRRNLFESVIARAEFEVLLAPYSIVEKDAESLATVAWRVIVFDEGHRL
jgi:hypothetical protein